MAQVIARCRHTGHYMFIAMDADRKEFGHSRGPFTRQFCPFCDTEHLWYKEDARLLRPTTATSEGVQRAS
jgi:hypothetical protein